MVYIKLGIFFFISPNTFSKLSFVIRYQLHICRVLEILGKVTEELFIYFFLCASIWIVSTPASST